MLFEKSMTTFKKLDNEGQLRGKYLLQLDAENEGKTTGRSYVTEIKDLLHDVGVPAHISGHDYLCEAIIMAVDDMKSAKKISYPEIAIKFNTTTSWVERSMRYAIEVAWSRGDIETLYKSFGYTINMDKGKTTNTEFVAMMSDIIRLKIIAKNESKTYVTEITDILHDVGVPAHTRGHDYLREAIIMAVDDMKSVKTISYPEIATKFNTTTSRVERDMRYAIGVAWLRGNIETIEKLFSYTVSSEKGKPTNTEFVAMIADTIRLK